MHDFGDELGVEVDLDEDELSSKILEQFKAVNVSLIR